MGGFGDAIKYLYSQFLLRDVLSFVVPGAIIIWAFLYRFCADLLEKDINWLLYIPIFGLLYVIGFAVQCLGEILGIILTQRLAESTWRKRLGFFGCGWLKKVDELQWWREGYKTIIEQHITINNKENSSLREWASQYIERLVVLKQMCGNNFCAIVLAVLVIGFSYIPIDCVKIVLVSLLIGLPLLLSLFWGHRVHVLRHNDAAAEIHTQLSQK